MQELNMTILTRKLAIAAALAASALSSAAMADTITLDSSNVGQSFTVSYNGFSNGVTVDGLGGTATFTLTSASANQYTFDYSVTNTTGNGVQSTISSFAMNIDPNISSATSTGAFDYAVLNSSYPNGLGAVDVCFKAGGSSSCAGNGGGVDFGKTGTGTMTLGFSAPTDAVTLNDFMLRYQAICGAGDVTSASGTGTITSRPPSGSSGGNPVPEPGMLGLLGLGLIGIGLMRSRTRQRFAPAIA